MKTLFLTLIVVSGLFSSCVYEKIEVSRLLSEDDVPTSFLGGEEEAVCGLMDVAYDLFTGSSFLSFFDDEMIEIAEKSTAWTHQDSVDFAEYAEDGLDQMFNASSSFESAYNEVASFSLEFSEFKEYSDSCVEPRGCWICNSRACAVSTAMTSLFEYNPSQYGWGVLGYIGKALHCP